MNAPERRRLLLSTRRTVPLDRYDEYLEAWARIRSAAEELGAHAWLFRARDRDDEFLEFIEFGRAPDALQHGDLADARRALEESFGHGSTEEWIDVH